MVGGAIMDSSLVMNLETTVLRYERSYGSAIFSTCQFLTLFNHIIEEGKEWKEERQGGRQALSKIYLSIWLFLGMNDHMAFYSTCQPLSPVTIEQ